MFPVALDIRKISVLLVGEGEAFAKRQAQLREFGASKLVVVQAVTASDEQIKSAVVIMVAGLSREHAERIAAKARDVGKLVNVEDVNDLCDFYFMAHVKRGDLLISVSTGGASPTLAKRVRDYIARRFDEEWSDIVETVKQYRLQLRAEGKNMKEVMQASDALLDEKGWLDCTRCKEKDAA